MLGFLKLLQVLLALHLFYSPVQCMVWKNTSSASEFPQIVSLQARITALTERLTERQTERPIATELEIDRQGERQRELNGEGEGEGEEEGDAALGLLHFELASALRELWLEKHIAGDGLDEACDSYSEAARLLRRESHIGTQAHSQSHHRELVQSLYYGGLLLKLLGRAEASVTSFREALNDSLSNVDKAAFLHAMADSQMVLGLIDQARGNYELALKFTPCKTERHFGYVQALREQTPPLSLQEWKSVLSRLLDLEKICGVLVSKKKEFIKKGSKNAESPFTAEEEKLLWEKDDLPTFLYETKDDFSAVLSSTSSDLFYSIFIAADSVDDKSTAWKYLVKAKKVEKAIRPPFDRAMAIEMKNRTTLAFNKEMVEFLPDVRKRASKVPIFILGMLRSGSTLLETMLDAHPVIWGVGEDSVFNGNLTVLRDSMMHAITTGTPAKVERVFLDFGKATIQGMKKMLRPQNPENSHKDIMKGKHIVDKMLFNHRNIGFINAVYPDALILHLVRDPMDTMFSIYRQKFDDQSLSWSLDVADIVLQYVLYLQYMAHFRKVIPGRVIDIRYEDLVNNPENILRNIIEERLKLPWDVRVLNFHSTRREVLTASQSQVRMTLRTSAIGSWTSYRQYLAPFIKEFRKYLPYLESEGMLPFQEFVNWHMDADFDYSHHKTNIEMTANIVGETAVGA